MQDSSDSEASGLRRRSIGQDPSRPTNMEVTFQLPEGVIRGTPSPSTTKIFTDDNAKPHSLSEFRMKQQSFEIHIEDCDEEEMSAGSSDEEGSRPVTPAPPTLLADCSGNVVYKEKTSQDFLQVQNKDNEVLTDVSEGESDNDYEEEESVLPENSVIKRNPSV